MVTWLHEEHTYQVGDEGDGLAPGPELWHAVDVLEEGVVCPRPPLLAIPGLFLYSHGNIRQILWEKNGYFFSWLIRIPIERIK